MAKQALNAPHQWMGAGISMNANGWCLVLPLPLALIFDLIPDWYSLIIMQLEDDSSNNSGYIYKHLIDIPCVFSPFLLLKLQLLLHSELSNTHM
jgi:hypothetical protein